MVFLDFDCMFNIYFWEQNYCDFFKNIFVLGNDNDLNKQDFYKSEESRFDCEYGIGIWMRFPI